MSEQPTADSRNGVETDELARILARQPYAVTIAEWANDKASEALTLADLAQRCDDPLVSQRLLGAVDVWHTLTHWLVHLADNDPTTRIVTATDADLGITH